MQAFNRGYLAVQGNKPCFCTCGGVGVTVYISGYCIYSDLMKEKDVILLRRPAVCFVLQSHVTIARSR